MAVSRSPRGRSGLAALTDHFVFNIYLYGYTSQEPRETDDRSSVIMQKRLMLFWSLSLSLSSYLSHSYSEAAKGPVLSGPQYCG